MERALMEKSLGTGDGTLSILISLPCSKSGGKDESGLMKADDSVVIRKFQMSERE